MIAAAPLPVEDYSITLKGISKTFSNGVVANNNVTFGVLKGEVHALLGENGAGKTTLMKILSGCLSPDSGEIYVCGERVSITDPIKAMRLGIGMVHQHFTLIPTFTVAENIALSLSMSGRLDLRSVKEKIAEVSKNINLDINPDARIEQLPIGLKQRVEILRLLCQDVDVLILDEPTSVLTPLEVEELFKIIKELKGKGKAIVIITHKVKEALAISDRISILRSGDLIKTMPARATNESELTSLIVEGFVPSLMIDRVKAGDRLLLIEKLRVKGDRGEEAVKEVDLTLNAGEILGIAGVAGNGQKELVEAITGLRKTEAGKSSISGSDITNRPPKHIIDKGVSYIPEDRIKRGVILNMTVAENLALKSIEGSPFSKRTIIDEKVVGKSAEGLISRFGIKVSDPNTMTSNLSGGNIQKLVVARELTLRSRVIIAEQPTAGLDVKASEAVHERLMVLRGEGVGIILISSDLDEIIKLSDRIMVMYNGEFVGELSYRELDVQKLAKMMLGASG